MTRRPNEVRAVVALAFEELSAFPGAIRDMHLGIAGRAFRGVGPVSRPVQVVHDTVSRRAYDAVSWGTAQLGLAAGVAIESCGVGRRSRSRPRAAGASHWLRSTASSATGSSAREASFTNPPRCASGVSPSSWTGPR